MNRKTYMKYTLIYMNGLGLLILYILDINDFITNNIHILLLGLYGGFVIYAIIWDKTHQNEEPPMKTGSPNKPILIEMKPIEGVNKSFDESSSGLDMSVGNEKIQEYIKKETPQSGELNESINESTKQKIRDAVIR